jgi:glycosyltransferase involved in cell wall biosynthesis
VLARDTVFNREVLADTGRFVANEVSSVTELIDAMDSAPDEAAAFRDRAPRRILERYTWEQIADAYDQLFRSTVSAPIV